MRRDITGVAEQVVAAVINEVPSYSDPFRGQMGRNIEVAVEGRARGLPRPGRAAGGDRRRRPDRVGARRGVRAGPRRGPQRSQHGRARPRLPRRRPGRLARDERGRGGGRPVRDARPRGSPSSCSPTSTSCPTPASPATPTSWRPRAGCGSDGSSGSRCGCSRERRRPSVVGAAERADWAPPTSLVAVILPEDKVRPVIGRLDGQTLQLSEDAPSLDIESGLTVLLVPVASAKRARGAAPPGAARLRRRRRTDTSVDRVRSSYRRALRAQRLGYVLGHRDPSRRAGPHRRRRRARRPARAGARAPAGRARPPPPRSSPRPWPPGCATRAAATRSQPRCSCTRRPCATGWASSATCTATGSPTRRSCGTRRSRSPDRAAAELPDRDRRHVRPEPRHPPRSARRRRRSPRRPAPPGCARRPSRPGGGRGTPRCGRSAGAGAGCTRPSFSTNVPRPVDVRVPDRLAHRQDRRDAGVGAVEDRRPLRLRPLLEASRR